MTQAMADRLSPAGPMRRMLRWPAPGNMRRKQLARAVDVEPAQEVHVLELDAPRPDAQAAQRRRPAGHDQGVEVREPQREGRAAAGVALGVLVVVGGLEGADGLAHQREKPVRGPIAKMSGWRGSSQGASGQAVGREQQGGQPAAAGAAVAPVHLDDLAPPGSQLHVQHAKMVADHDSPPAAAASAGAPGTSRISRQSWGQKPTQRPQWRHTCGSLSAVRNTASTGQARAHSPQRMHCFLRTTTPPPARCVNAPVGQAAAHGAGSQARQVRASKPVDRPPAEAMRIPAVFQERILVHQARAGERTRVAADAALHVRGRQDLHGGSGGAGRLVLSFRCSVLRC